MYLNSGVANNTYYSAKLDTGQSIVFLSKPRYEIPAKQKLLYRRHHKVCHCLLACARRRPSHNRFWAQRPAKGTITPSRTVQRRQCPRSNLDQSHRSNHKSPVNQTRYQTFQTAQSTTIQGGIGGDKVQRKTEDQFWIEGVQLNQYSSPDHQISNQKRRSDSALLDAPINVPSHRTLDLWTRILFIHDRYSKATQQTTPKQSGLQTKAAQRKSRVLQSTVMWTSVIITPSKPWK